MEELSGRKARLAKGVERKRRLVAEVGGSVAGHERRIRELEDEIARRTSGGRQISTTASGDEDGENDDADDHEEGTDTSEPSRAAEELEDEVRRYELRLRVHSNYTARALRWFLNSLDAARTSDVDGLLFGGNEGGGNDDGGDGEGRGDEIDDKEERRQLLLEEIAFDVDIQLSNLERMIKDVDAKKNEYMQLCKANTAAAAGDSPEEKNDLLSLTQECADLLGDFISTISEAMESTVLRRRRGDAEAPHSFSIEFQHQPATSSPMSAADTTTGGNECSGVARASDGPDSNAYTATISDLHTDDECNKCEGGGGGEVMPYFQIQRKRLQLHELQRSRLQVDTSISLLQNDIQTFQAAIHEENRLHCEIMSNLQSKLHSLMGRLEAGDGGDGKWQHRGC